jgi:hypothetical protein
MLEKFPSKANREEDCVGYWREHPQLRTRERRFHPALGVNERIIAKPLTDSHTR